MESNERTPEDEEKPREHVPLIISSPPCQIDRDVTRARILDACKWKDIETLRILATAEGGLVSDDIRRQACSYHCGGS